MVYSYCEAANSSKPQREEAKRRLALLLWQHLSERNLCSPPRSAEVRLDKTALGKPFLANGESDGPSISFSRSGSVIWGAACGCHAEIGVDGACAVEFTGDYPCIALATRKSMRCSDLLQAAIYRKQPH